MESITENIVCKYDGGVTVTICNNNKYFEEYKYCVTQKEVIFRKIHFFLIQNGYIPDNIIDAGAFIGDNSIPWAKNINGIVYAIDPSKENCAFIQKLAELNNVHNINIIQSALSSKIEILCTNSDMHMCRFVDTKQNIFENGINNINSVPLDYLYDTHKIDKICYIHLDVEGMENIVINGANKIIDTFNPIITIEQHLKSDDYVQLCDHLKHKNYSIFIINERAGSKKDCRNIIAFPNKIVNLKFIDDIHKFVDKKHDYQIRKAAGPLKIMTQM
jgi:FkbM family methyltransferase